MDDALVLLAGRRLSKRFGAVQVLFDVSIELRAGEVHAAVPSSHSSSRGSEAARARRAKCSEA